MSELMEIVLENNSGIAQAEALAGRLESAFQQSLPVIINGSAVTRVDAAILQLLYAFVAAMKAANIGASWKAPSEVLCDAADRLGLKDLLEL